MSEVVPAGRLPRSFTVRALAPRMAESYVVTVIQERQVHALRNLGDRAERTRAASLGSRRVWPRVADLRAEAAPARGFAGLRGLIPSP